MEIKRWVAGVALVTYLTIPTGQSGSLFAQLIVDGEFGDWPGETLAHADPAGDPFDSDVDFGRLWMAETYRFLVLRLEVGAELNLQNDNLIVLYLDTDNNPDTGEPINGIGADLEWRFGERWGTFFVGATGYQIQHDNIGIVTAPTVSSDEFEIALDKSARPVFAVPLFSADTIKIAFMEDVAGGDQLPDAGETVSYGLADPTPRPRPPTHIGKEPGFNLRTMSHNVLRDGPFDAGRAARFARILRALQPDVIGFQEIYDHSAAETRAFVSAALPSIGSETWYAAKAGTDNIAVTRYPITSTHEIMGNAAFLLDLRSHYNTGLLLIVAHPPCCANNEGRQREIDAIMAFIRDAKSGAGPLHLARRTPIIIMGDMNLVGHAQQLTTLLTGDIVNEAEFGPDFSPDWDDGPFADLMPIATGRPMTFTWYDIFSSFSPGQLDYIIYSQPLMALDRFVLFTPALPEDTLSAHGLEAEDAPAASDHLPVVCDFDLPLNVGVGDRREQMPQSFTLEQSHPNPLLAGGVATTTIAFRVPEPGQVRVGVYDVTGRRVRSLGSSSLSAGRHRVTWDGRDDGGHLVAAGVYVYRVEAMGENRSGKLIVIR